MKPNKSHGLLMSAPMILAYLAGKKTQTRRLKGLKLYNQFPDAWQVMERIPGRAFVIRNLLNGSDSLIHSPYGWKGDPIYFKETYAVMCRVAAPTCECETDQQIQDNHYIEYRADTGNAYPGEWPADEAKGNEDAPKWRSSLFMPQRFSRAHTTVADVHLARLHKIKPEDVEAEGIHFIDDSWYTGLDGNAHRYTDKLQPYAELWDRLNGDTTPWIFNPWVWIISFPKYEGMQP